MCRIVKPQFDYRVCGWVWAIKALLLRLEKIVVMFKFNIHVVCKNAFSSGMLSQKRGKKVTKLDVVIQDWIFWWKRQLGIVDCIFWQNKISCF